MLPIVLPKYQTIAKMGLLLIPMSLGDLEMKEGECYEMESGDAE